FITTNELLMRIKNAKLCFPTIRAFSGSDIYFNSLCDGFKKLGCDANIHWMKYKHELIPFYYKTLLKHLYSADLIHANCEYGYFFKDLNKKMTLVLHHNVFESEYQRFTKLYQKAYHYGLLKNRLKRSIKYADRIISVSMSTKKSFCSQFQIPEDTVVTIYNGINQNLFIPKSNRDDTLHRLIFVGTMSIRKGVDILLDVMKRLGGKFELVCVSQRPKNMKKCPDNLQIIENVTAERLSDLYNQSDILVFPTRLEGFGYAVAEAMACGLPVVASNCSAIPELVDHGKGGFLCSVGDVDDFAEKINILAESPKMRKEMGEYNRAKVEKYFTLDRMVKEYKELFEEVLDASAHR
ncbi:MAG: glycosyltransferase family 4 protein, partial [Desulfobacterales bacterium]